MTEHNHPQFVLTVLPNGTVDLSVCWDQTNVRDIAKTLRQVAGELDDMPEDTEAIGIRPL